MGDRGEDCNNLLRNCWTAFQNPSVYGTVDNTF